MREHTGHVRQIKLSGRERSVVRAIGFGLGVTGQELVERTGLAPEDLVDVLNGLIDAGFAESEPPTEPIAQSDLETHAFEVNPAYAHELKNALGY